MCSGEPGKRSGAGQRKRRCNDPVATWSVFTKKGSIHIVEVLFPLFYQKSCSRVVSSVNVPALTKEVQGHASGSFKACRPLANSQEEEEAAGILVVRHNQSSFADHVLPPSALLCSRWAARRVCGFRTSRAYLLVDASVGVSVGVETVERVLHDAPPNITQRLPQPRQQRLDPAKARAVVQ